MANMVDAVWSKAAAYAGRWLRVATLMVLVLSGVVAASVRPGVEPVDLSRQAATGGAATARSGCSTAWAAG